MPRSRLGVIRGSWETNAIRPATDTHTPTIWIPECAMGPDHTHIRSVVGGDTRCATSYGLQNLQSWEK